MQANAQQWTAWKNLLRDGGPAAAALPASPTLPLPPPAQVAPGVIGAEQVVDPSSWKPVLASQMQAGHPVVLWTKGGASAVWKYKAIYRLHDEQVGQWSDILSVTVGG